VALLKDRNGLIALQVPIEGNIDSPEFNYRAVFSQAVKTILSNVAKSPFRALGRSMGVDGENLDLVAFDPGMATFVPPEAEKLGKIASELAARPELTLEIEGRFDPELDTSVMKKTKLGSLITARRDLPNTGTEPPSLESVLETLYAETFSPERLAQERARFTTTPAPPPPEPPKSARQRKPVPQTVTMASAASFDGEGFYDEVRKQLVAAQPITPEELHALGRARAAAIASAMTATGTLQATRIKALDPTQAARNPGSQQVRSEMKLSIGKTGTTEAQDD
jgi:hypothetical protein